jgi:hypothetical protein
MSESSNYDHTCKYRDDGGDCIFCGKTVSEQLEEKQKRSKLNIKPSLLESQVFNYLNYQFPATVGHIPLQNMLHNIWLDGVKEACRIAEREEKYNEMDTRISTRIKDLLK